MTKALFLLLLTLVTLVESDSNFTNDWFGQCQQRITNIWQNADQTSIIGNPVLNPFIGPDRKPDPSRNLTTAWGITYSYCSDHCNDITTFSFVAFATATTNWLLPWLALAAQLPYETATPFEDVGSALLAIGSPMLVTYSLVTSMLVKRQIHKRFTDLIHRASGSNVKKEYSQLIRRLVFARFITMETLQAPMRLWTDSGCLSSLIVLEGNQSWWETVHDRLQHTRRGVTVSLIVQVLFAAVAWIFTVVSAASDLFLSATSNAVASSTLWLWLAPIVTGWVSVGTQFRSGTIGRALNGTNISVWRAQPQRDPQNAPRPFEKFMSQDGFRVTTGILYTDEDDFGYDFTPTRLACRGLSAGFPLRSLRSTPVVTNNGLQTNPAESSTSADTMYKGKPRSPLGDKLTITDTAIDSDGRSSPYHDDPNHSGRQALIHVASISSDKPTFWGFKLTGAEGQEGPIHNYARIFTHLAYTETLLGAFSRVVSNIRQGKSPQGRWVARVEGVKQHVHNNLSGTTQEITDFCGLQEIPLAYQPWSNIPSGLIRDIIVASIVAGGLQWGTTGSAILIAYFAPPIGLGCVTGSFVLYGVLATVSWALLLTASLLSHSLMARHQKLRDQDKSALGFWGPVFFVLTRIVGTAMAFANAILLVVFSILDLAGYFNGCWCASDFLSTRGNLGVQLFVGPRLESPYIGRYWAGGIAMGTVVCILAWLFFWLGTKRRS